MISGIGTDLVHIPRIAEMLNKYGDKAAQRILDDSEFEQFQKTSNQPHFWQNGLLQKKPRPKPWAQAFVTD